MSYATFKTVNKEHKINEEIVVQITKRQHVNFFRYSVLVSALIVNFFAIRFNSPLLLELLTAQIVIGLILLNKDLSTNSTLK